MVFRVFGGFGVLLRDHAVYRETQRIILGFEGVRVRTFAGYFGGLFLTCFVLLFVLRGTFVVRDVGGASGV